ncbi:MAG: pyrroline-5-carboxylate reductase, partial [Acidimicrobiaceae bacterium]|nr:pyrroline-5-carboxylate reductase [Acidimicrobiaceae bacterium]
RRSGGRSLELPPVSAKLVVVGGGKMGEALVAGLLAAGWAKPDEIVVAEALAARRDQLLGPEGLAGRNPGLVITASPAGVEGSEAAGALVAVKPGDTEAACRSLAAAHVGRVLSIAAGVTLARLQEWSGEGMPVVRAMPNTPALIGAGAAAIAPGACATEADMAWAEEILGSVGTVVRVPESLLDAVTGLSGSGPAYIFLVAEALIEAGVLVGLPRPVSQQLAVQTLLGSARLLAESDQGPEALRAAVTSPGGTTAAGLRALEAAAVRSAFLDAVVAATERSRALGG